MALQHTRCVVASYTLLVAFMLPTYGGEVSIGPDGIQSAGLGLTGNGVAIGMVEDNRPGDAGLDSANMRNTHVDPAAVFVRDVYMVPAADTAISDHAEAVASILISTDNIVPGVAPDADLFASATAPGGGDDLFDLLARSLQFIATRNAGDVRAMNMSYSLRFDNETQDGNSPITAFVDWSSRVHNTLYVVAGNQLATDFPHPTDSFNGLTVARSRMNGGVFREVSPQNDYSKDADGVRTSIDLLAPGDQVTTTILDDIIEARDGTSYAAPHVVGTAALLQEHTDTQIGASAARWDNDAKRHTVMKAVLMNSADKLIDDGTVVVNGTPVPQGGLLGMTRTVIDQNGDTWLDSEAYDDSGFATGAGTGIPLDDQMGAGHLNASRALTQFQPGEYDVTPQGVSIPRIGWDYGNTDEQFGANAGRTKYDFTDNLIAGTFVSITLAWDRIVNLDTDGGTQGAYDTGDDFKAAGDFEEGFNGLDLYLMPDGAIELDEAVASSFSATMNLEHIFFQIPTTGKYEIWVDDTFGQELSSVTEYALAWWAAGDGNMGSVSGDYDGSGTVDTGDYTAWKNTFGNIVTAGSGADGNGDGVINLADYTVWRDNLGASSAAAAVANASVPEPGTFFTSAIFAVVGLASFSKAKEKKGLI